MLKITDRAVKFRSARTRRVGVEAVGLVARPEQRRDGELQRRQGRAQVGRRRGQAIPAQSHTCALLT